MIYVIARSHYRNALLNKAFGMLRCTPPPRVVLKVKQRQALTKLKNYTMLSQQKKHLKTLLNQKTQH
jgi:hypothetical protein